MIIVAGKIETGSNFEGPEGATHINNKSEGISHKVRR
jgi:hypothetical protein